MGDVAIGDAPIDWLIAGGESGAGFRPVDPDHVRSLRDQSLSRGIAFFFKQWGGIRPKSSGKILDGREWCQFPTLRICSTNKETATDTVKTLRDRQFCE